MSDSTIKPWREVSYTIPHRDSALYPYCFEAPIDKDGVPELTEAMLWCEEHFGERSGRWGRWAYSAQDLIFVKDETDAMVFKIRWC
ncbi:MAG: hypothetical protein EOP83_21935 [Verrucomicrobiaceae bacterium]|nr:MAG: hypothetical protein EOP83_21935 [Verrucomicrobiaceae bacterium]